MIRSLAFISNNAFTLINFRGPLIAELVKHGIRVFALAPDHDDEKRAQLRCLGAEPIDISLHRMGLSPLRGVGDVVRLSRQLRQIRPDATFAYFLKPVAYGGIAAALARIGRRYSLIEGLGYYFTPGEPETIKRRVVRAAMGILLRLALRMSNRVFFLNDEDLNLFVHRGYVDYARATQLGGIGVDLEVFAPALPLDGPPTFILAARLLREKGVVEFVEAARIVKEYAPEARFVLLGGIDENPGAIAEEEVQGWVNEGLIEWTGHVSDVRPWMAQAWAFVLPSYYREGVPRSTQEAMAMARPVVTTNGPGCRETIVDGKNGFVVPARDPEAVAAALGRFIREPELVATMGRESRRLAEERFDIHAINAKLLSAMEILPLPDAGHTSADLQA